jgi:aminopeptidase YwaD
VATCRVAMLMKLRRTSLLLLALASLALTACGGNGSPSATSTLGPTRTAPAPTATATAKAGSFVEGVEPSGALAFQHVEALAVDIGPRPAGSDAEAEAASYIADQLRSYGYVVEEQTFEFTSEFGREASLDVTAPDRQELVASAFTGSAAGRVEGGLVFAGLGRPEEFPPEGLQGSVALLRRGELYFADKVRNAAEAGAGAAVIFNNDPGFFEGSLGSEGAIPVVSISREDGERLLALLEQAPVEVSMEVEAPVERTSRNVIGRPASGRCETVSGGHFDSVPQAPGASDNASGTATVLELARTVAVRHLPGDNCFVLFGAEELGLLGSQHFVQTLDEYERQELRAMLNFDMTGVGESWLLIGSPELVTEAAQAAAGAGIQAEPSEQPGGLGSDHQSFLSANVPAIWFFRVTDNLLHTPQDTADRVQPDQMEEAVTMGLLLLEDLQQGP